MSVSEAQAGSEHLLAGDAAQLLIFLPQLAKAGRLVSYFIFLSVNIVATTMKSTSSFSKCYSWF